MVGLCVRKLGVLSVGFRGIMWLRFMRLCDGWLLKRFCWLVGLWIELFVLFLMVRLSYEYEVMEVLVFEDDDDGLL